MAEHHPKTGLDWDGPLSPPRRNGEIVFDALWESRVFGLTMTLCEHGAFRWEEFRDCLIDAIADWERAHHLLDEVYPYWDCWLVALEGLVAEKGLCSKVALETRVADLAARPAGYDHNPKDASGNARTP